MKIRKAIIPAAGLGTRFLPATKAMPKEMLPIVDKPTIQYIVEEAVESGIEDIIIVTGRGKRAIEDHFDNYFELEHSLLEKGKLDLLNEVRKSSKLVDIHYIRQKEPKGLGHAVWCARKFVGDEPFAVLLGDDIVQSEVPCLRQMIDQYNKYQSSIVGVQPVPTDEVSRYGIVKAENSNENISKILQIVEKPKKDESPSNLAVMGRYILTPKIFNILESQGLGTGGEIQLTDAISTLLNYEKVYSLCFEGKRFDVGEKVGFIKTTIEFALQNNDIRGQILPFLERIINEQKVLDK